jgi:hypothetical protein
MSHNKARNILVFDIEGADSEMNNEERQVSDMAILTFSEN